MLNRVALASRALSRWNSSMRIGRNRRAAHKPTSSAIAPNAHTWLVELLWRYFGWVWDRERRISKTRLLSKLSVKTVRCCAQAARAATLPLLLPFSFFLGAKRRTGKKMNYEQGKKLSSGGRKTNVGSKADANKHRTITCHNMKQNNWQRHYDKRNTCESLMLGFVLFFFRLVEKIQKNNKGKINNNKRWKGK